MRYKLQRLFSFLHSSHLVFLLLLEIGFGFILTIGSLFLFIEIARHVMWEPSGYFDTLLMYFAYSLRTHWLNLVMQAVTFFGGPLFLGIGTILTAIMLAFYKRRKDALAFVLVFCLGLLINLYLKDIFQRPRPEIMPMFAEWSYSFPSGHSMNSFVFYVTFAYIVVRKLSSRSKKYLLYAACGGLPLLIGFSRIYLGVHYPSDVLAGFVAGFCLFVTVLVFDHLLLFFRLLRGYKGS